MHLEDVSESGKKIPKSTTEVFRLEVA